MDHRVPCSCVRKIAKKEYMQVISVSHLSKSYEYYEKNRGLAASFKNLVSRKKLKKDAVRDISFDIGEGEFVGFIGPNGAGKTTTLKTLSGILYPDCGHASVLGFTPWERKKDFKMRFSLIMGQKSQLIFDLPAIESFYLNKTIYEVPDADYRAVLDELVELLGVGDLLKTQVRRLSLGERMKMELIAGLVHRPAVLFLDEPTIGLDVLSQRKIRDFFRAYNRNYRVTILLTSHYMHDIEELCERVILINEGSIMYDGSLDDMADISGTRKIIKLELEKPVPESEFARFGAVRDVSDLSVTIEIDRDYVKERAKAMLESLPIVDLTISDIPIEETVALMYRRRENA